MHASASLSEDTCCWVYFTECKVHQLPSRLPKIFHCKLLSSREHGYKYKYTKVMLLDFPPPPPPRSKGNLSCHFSWAAYKDGATWGCWELPEEEKTGSWIVIGSGLKTSFCPPSSSGKSKLPRTPCPSVSNAWVYLQQSWCFPHPKWEKCLPREFFGEKTSPGLRFFFPSPSIS